MFRKDRSGKEGFWGSKVFEDEPIARKRGDRHEQYFLHHWCCCCVLFIARAIRTEVAPARKDLRSSRSSNRMYPYILHEADQRHKITQSEFIFGLQMADELFAAGGKAYFGASGQARNEDLAGAAPNCLPIQSRVCPIAFPSRGSVMCLHPPPWLCARICPRSMHSSRHRAVPRDISPSSRSIRLPIRRHRSCPRGGDERQGSFPAGSAAGLAQG